LVTFYLSGVSRLCKNPEQKKQLYAEAGDNQNKQTEVYTAFQWNISRPGESFPEAIEDYAGQDNPVRFIDAFVDKLDMFTCGFLHTQVAETGRPPYDPMDLLKLSLYGYLHNKQLYNAIFFSMDVCRF
jgi:transposase